MGQRGHRKRIGGIDHQRRLPLLALIEYVGNLVPRPCEPAWLDICGVVGPLGIYAWFVTRKIASGPLLPLKDPLLHEALSHKNYV